ncbi:hypothetical protein Tco_0164230 [Tanacetum coccineum]
MTLENKKTINVEAEAETMNHLNPNPTPQQPSLHLIDVENYDASPNIILIASDDDEDDEDKEDAAPPHHNLISWNWDDVIVIPSDDEADEKPVSVIGRKRVYALIDESDSDEEYWSNAFF